MLAAAFAFWQAREARTQAKAADRQAKAAEEQVALMRQEQVSAQPSFVVMVRAAEGLGSGHTDEGELYFFDTGTSHVQITIENTSTREATINHVGFGFSDRSYEQVQHLENIQMPTALGPGRQFVWSLSQRGIRDLVDLSDPGSDSCEVYFFVSQDPPFSTQRRWESDLITLNRPKRSDLGSINDDQ